MGARKRMIIGIVGAEEAKFTTESKAKAIEIIRELLIRSNVTGFSSGACPKGGVDVWAEEIVDALNSHRMVQISKHIFSPKSNDWETGFKPRNIDIATISDELHCITPKLLPDGKPLFCYHCKTDEHVRNGGCWTLKYAVKHFKTKVELHVV